LGQPKKCYNPRIFLGNKSKDLFKLHILLAYWSKGNTGCLCPICISGN
jgi:hypothetical protein